LDYYKKTGVDIMSEEEQKESKEQPEPQAPDMVEAANKAAERLEAANKKSEELVKRQEGLAVQSALGGQSAAGQTEEKEEETPAEYAKKVMAGEVNE